MTAPRKMILAEYTTQELCQELRRREEERPVETPITDTIEFGPMGAWRSYFGQLRLGPYDGRDRDEGYGLLLPVTDRCDMEFKSSWETDRAIEAAGWSQ